MYQIVASVILVLLTLSLQCAGVATLIVWLRKVTAAEIHKGSLFEAGILVMQTTIAVIALHVMVVLVWASFFHWVCFRSWDSAVYFSGTSYTTVGYGDIVLPQKWRLLGPLEGMLGVLMCGMSVSLLFALVNWLIDRDKRFYGYRKLGAATSSMEEQRLSPSIHRSWNNAHHR